MKKKRDCIKYKEKGKSWKQGKTTYYRIFLGFERDDSDAKFIGIGELMEKTKGKKKRYDMKKRGICEICGHDRLDHLTELSQEKCAIDGCDCKQYFDQSYRNEGYYQDFDPRRKESQKRN